MRIIYTIVLASFLLITDNLSAQGCSDAGVCTLSSFKPNHGDSMVAVNNQFKVGLSFGLADYDIMVAGNYVEYNRQINRKLSADIRVTSLVQNGNNINAIGLSDIYLNTNYKAGNNVVITAGLKLPLTNGNKSENNIALPMDYQSSLGTVDLLLGVGFAIKNLQMVVAAQQPLTQNSNGFFASNYLANSRLSTFQTTNNFKRSGDVLMRFSYPINYDKKVKITPSLLPIYHLTTDKFTNELGVEESIAGSNGLTVNGNIYVDFYLKNNKTFQLSVGSPFVVRENRPDGLTRGFVLNIEYSKKF